MFLGQRVWFLFFLLFMLRQEQVQQDERDVQKTQNYRFKDRDGSIFQDAERSQYEDRKHNQIPEEGVLVDLEGLVDGQHADDDGERKVGGPEQLAQGHRCHAMLDCYVCGEDVWGAIGKCQEGQARELFVQVECIRESRQVWHQKIRRQQPQREEQESD